MEIPFTLFGRHPGRRRYSTSAAALLLALGCAAAQAQGTAGARQDPDQIRQAVQVFLLEQTAGLTGQVNTQISNLDPRLTLAQCDAPQPFLPKGGRLWGKTTIGVRCLAPANWTIYMQVQVQVLGEYIVSARPISNGQLLQADQFTKIKGELNSLPNGIVTDVAQLAGQTINTSLPAGAPVRLDSLRKQQVISAGQIVRLSAKGPGFQVSSEARAILGASEGQVVQVKTPGGQQVSGVARAGGVVEVVN